MPDNCGRGRMIMEMCELSIELPWTLTTVTDARPAVFKTVSWAL